ncbi:chloroplast envelope quinone oxidoreductase homolog [Oryza brachyantha]|nr:chloroplast envelope quinone oxidoreductase homolog [Oryza brachyantha]
MLAKLAGLHVTAACGARNLGFVGGLGADVALDYKTLDIGEEVRRRGALRAAGAVVDVQGRPGRRRRRRRRRQSWRVAATATAFLHKVTFSKKRLVPLILMRKKEEMEWLVDMARQGKLKTTIDSTYPLSRAHEAWAKSMEGHATGKIIVEMASTD